MFYVILGRQCKCIDCEAELPWINYYHAPVLFLENAAIDFLGICDKNMVIKEANSSEITYGVLYDNIIPKKSGCTPQYPLRFTYAS